MSKVKRTEQCKKDFISIISSMTDNEINEYIKAHGKPPKPIEMCTIINPCMDEGLEEWITKIKIG